MAPLASRLAALSCSSLLVVMCAGCERGGSPEPELPQAATDEADPQTEPEAARETTQGPEAETEPAAEDDRAESDQGEQTARDRTLEEAAAERVDRSAGAGRDAPEAEAAEKAAAPQERATDDEASPAGAQPSGGETVTDLSRRAAVPLYEEDGEYSPMLGALGPAGGPVLKIGRVRKVGGDGELDARHLQAELGDPRDLMKLADCYAKTLNTGGEVAGVIETRFRVTAQGGVEDVATVANRTGKAALARCARAHASSGRYLPAPSAEVTYVYEARFELPDGQ